MPNIIKFSPWFISGKDNISESLLRTIDIELNGLKKWRQKFYETNGYKLSLFEKIYKFPVGILLWFFDLFHLFKIVPKISDKIFAWLHNSEDYTYAKIMAEKVRVEKSILKEHKKIIVFIDDIDRLSPNEIIQVFSSLKNNSNLNNVIYLLAMDKDVVFKALKKMEMDIDYLDKIVQFSFDMPRISYSNMLNLIYYKIEKNFNENVLDDIIERNIINISGNIITEPRSFLKFFNSLKFSYNVLEKDVNFSDLFILEIFKHFEVNFYENIYKNKDLFISSLQNPSENQKSKIKELLKKTIKNQDNFDFYSKILSILISPEKLFENNIRKKRFLSPLFFDKYFSLFGEIDKLTYTEFNNILNEIGLKNEVLIPHNKQIDFLKILETEEINKNNFKVFWNCVFGDVFKVDTQHYVFLLKKMVRYINSENNSIEVEKIMNEMRSCDHKISMLLNEDLSGNLKEFFHEKCINSLWVKSKKDGGIRFSENDIFALVSLNNFYIKNSKNTKILEMIALNLFETNDRNVFLHIIMKFKCGQPICCKDFVREPGFSYLKIILENNQLELNKVISKFKYFVNQSNKTVEEKERLIFIMGS